MSQSDTNTPDVTEDPQIQAWIVAMFRELGLGTPQCVAAPEVSDETTLEEAALAEAREQILTVLDGLSLPDALPDDELKPVQDHMTSVRGATEPPIDGERLEAAAAVLAALPGQIDALNVTLKDRQDRIALAKSAAQSTDDPEHAIDTEKTALQLLRDADAFSPTGKVSEPVTVAAEEALKALQAEIAKVEMDATARESKRQELIRRVVRIAPPMTARGSSVLALLKEIGTERSAIELAITLGDISARETEITKLETKVQELGKLEAARLSAVTALDAARELVHSKSKTVEVFCFEAALEKLSSAASSVDSAKSEANYATAKTAIAKIAPFLVQAEDYYAYMIDWRFKATFYIGTLGPNSDPVAKAQRGVLELFRDTLLHDAGILAKGGNAVAAKNKLAEFYSTTKQYEHPDTNVMTDVAVEASKNTDAIAFAARIETFRTDSLPTISLANKLGLEPQTRHLRTAYDAAKSKGCTNGNFGDATTDLDALKTVLASDVQPVLDKFQDYVAAAENPALEPQITVMKEHLENQRYAQALAVLSAMDTAHGGDLKNAAEFEAKRARLSNSVKWVSDQVTGPLKASIQDPWTAAPSETTHLAKMEKLGRVEAALPGLRSFITARDAAERMHTRLDASSATDIGAMFAVLDDARTKAAAGNLGPATTAYQLALPHLERLGAYLDAAAKLKAAGEALPPAQGALKLKIAGALTQAEADAKSKKWDDADAKLAEDLKDPEVIAQAGLIDRFEARRKRAEAQKARVQKRMTSQKAKEKLDVPFDDAVGKSKTGAFIEASEALDVLQPLLDEAQQYVAAAMRARRAVAALEAINTRLRNAESDAAQKDTITAAIYPAPNDKAKIDTDMAAAEADATAGKYSEATVKFRAICANAETGMIEAASRVEALEHGHYVAAHGPQTDLDKQKERVLTGVRPDGKKVPTSTASKFENIGDLLATRELAWEQAMVKNTKVTNGKTTLQDGDVLEVIVNTDCPAPIGESYVSDAPRMEYRAGEYKEGKTFENCEHIPGLTRVFTKIVFMFDPPAGSSRRETSWDKVKQEYDKHSVTHPTDWPGEWVVHQHYPTPEGFDPLTGEYD